MRGANLPCDAPARRSLSGWVMLALVAGLAAFYVVVIRAMLSPPDDEAFRRTFITGEFGAYPTSPEFKGRNGLAYRFGDTVTLRGEKPRLYLSRFDWHGEYHEGPWLKASIGRLFLHMEPGTAPSDRPLSLSLGLSCAMPAGTTTTLAVAVNGVTLGEISCADQGGVPARFTLPPGLVGHGYDEIRVTRDAGDLSERIATRLGLRMRAVSVESFRIGE